MEERRSKEMKPPVLVTRKIQERPLNLLQEQAQVTIHLENRPMTPDEIIAQLPGKVGLLAAGGDPLSANLLEAGKNFENRANNAVGFNKIDLAAPARPKMSG